MADFNFKQIIRENLYNQQYPHQDKVRIILNEGQTLMLEREIHEGIMDFLKGFTKKKPGWKEELGDQIDTWLNRSSVLNDKRKAQLKNYYMKNMSDLPDAFYKDGQALADVEDSLEAAVDGDMDAVKDEMEDAADDHGGEAGAQEEPASAPQEKNTPLGVSGTELQIMDMIARKNGADLFGVARVAIKEISDKFKNNEQAAAFMKSFNSKFFPQIKQLAQRVNIDVAESVEWSRLWKTLLREGEEEDVKTKMLGRASPKMIGKLLAKRIEAKYRQALLNGVTKDTLFDAAVEVSSGIKDPKTKKQYEDSVLRNIEKNPDRRLKMYSQNVDTVVGELVKLATAAAAEASGGREEGGDDEKSLSASSLRAALSGDEAASVKLKRQIAKSMADSGIKLPGGANPKSPIYGKIVDIISKVAKSTNTPGIKESKVDIYFEAYNNVIKAIKLHENKK